MSSRILPTPLFNVYKTVNVTLNTHDAGGITELDIKLAKTMDKFAGKAGR